MSSNLKITLVVIFAFIITFSTLITTEKIFGFDYYKNNKMKDDDVNNSLSNVKFYSKDFSNEKNIFLIGSSHVLAINVTQINNNELLNSSIVYNLGKNGDTPSKRLNELEQIIEAKPEIIFYGISYRDFNFIYNRNPDYFLPDIQEIFLDHTKNIKKEIENVIPLNPQLLTKTILINILEKPADKHHETIRELNTPFHEYDKNPKIATQNELKRMKIPVSSWNNKQERDQNIDSFNEIISKLRSHEIKIVLFSTPLHEDYLYSLSNYQKEQFTMLKNDIIENYGIKIYEFEEKYEGLDVWEDLSHISLAENVTIFNNDIAEMIISEQYN